MRHPRVWIKLGDERLTVQAASKRIGVAPMTLWNRLTRGVPKHLLLAGGYGPREKAELIQAVADHRSEQVKRG